MKKKPAPKWTAKARPVEEAGLALLRELEAGGNSAIDAATHRLALSGGDARKKLSLVSLGAVEVLQFVMAYEHEAGPAGAIAKRLRRVLEGATWNDAFDAPWVKNWEKVSEPVLLAFQRNAAFEQELATLRKKRKGATEDEALQNVAARLGLGGSTIRKARDDVRKMRAAKTSQEKD